MKKLYLSGSLLVLGLALASCGGSSMDYELAHSDVKDLGSVITEHLEFRSTATTKIETFSLTRAERQELGTGYTVLSSIKGPFVRVKDSNDKLGIYSYVDGKFLVKPSFATTFSINYTTVYYNSTAFADIFTITNGTKYNYVDNFGNVLAKDSDDAYSFSSVSIVENDYYITMTNKTTDERKYIKYGHDDNGKATIIKEMEEEEKEIYNKGDLFGSYTLVKHDDKKYYYTAYTLGEMAYLKVFDETKTFLKTVEIPFGTSAATTVLFSNGNVLLQFSREIPDGEDNYDYSAGGKKYALTSMQYNLFDNSGAKEVNVPYKLMSSSAVYNADGETVYYQAAVAKILGNKTLGPQNYYLLKDDFSLANKLEFSFGSMIKTGTGYLYNGNSADILYDKDLKVITTLGSNVGETYSKDLDLFKVSSDGRYGLIDSEGRVKVQFEYSGIDLTPTNNNKVYANNKDGERVILNISNGTTESIKDYSYHSGVYYHYNDKDNKTNFSTIYGGFTLVGAYSSYLTYSNYFGQKTIYSDYLDSTNPLYVVYFNDYYFNTVQF